jgi:hypothetical protein
MISRLWHGYTSLDNADAYENLLKSEIFVGINSRKIEGYRGIQLIGEILKTKLSLLQ